MEKRVVHPADLEAELLARLVPRAAAQTTPGAKGPPAPSGATGPDCGDVPPGSHNRERRRDDHQRVRDHRRQCCRRSDQPSHRLGHDPGPWQRSGRGCSRPDGVHRRSARLRSARPVRRRRRPHRLHRCGRREERRRLQHDDLGRRQRPEQQGRPVQRVHPRPARGSRWRRHHAGALRHLLRARARGQQRLESRRLRVPAVAGRPRRDRPGCRRLRLRHLLRDPDHRRHPDHCQLRERRRTGDARVPGLGRQRLRRRGSRGRRRRSGLEHHRRRLRRLDLPGYRPALRRQPSSNRPSSRASSTRPIRRSTSRAA